MCLKYSEVHEIANNLAKNKLQFKYYYNCKIAEKIVVNTQMFGVLLHIQLGIVKYTDSIKPAHTIQNST